MKKTTITFLTACLLMVSSVKAQSVQDGINHLNAGRPESAVSLFKKLLEVNPNNVEANYWLGQSYLELDEMVLELKQRKNFIKKPYKVAPMLLC